MKFEAVIFDLDGTLLDTLEDIADSANAVLSKMSFPEHPVDSYRWFVGDGMQELAKRALPEHNCEQRLIERFEREVKQQYSVRWADKTTAYPGIEEMLSNLEQRKQKIAALSNKPDEFTRIIMEKFFPEIHFDAVYGLKPDVPKKPAPSGALKIAQELRIPPEKFLYLGDTNTDMQTAVSAGMYPVGALWGFRDREELEANGAKALVDKPAEVIVILKDEELIVDR